MASKQELSGALWDADELSAYLKDVPTETLAQWRRRGIGPRYVKFGRHVRYRVRDVEAWLDRQSRGGEPGAA